MVRRLLTQSSMEYNERLSPLKSISHETCHVCFTMRVGRRAVHIMFGTSLNYPKAYSDAVERVLKDIEGNMNDALASAGSREAAELAVKNAGDEVARLQLNLRRALVRVPPNEALRLYTTGTELGERQLEDLWRTTLGY